MTATEANDGLVELTADLVTAYVSNNQIPTTVLPELISDVHAAIARLRTKKGDPNEHSAVSVGRPAVPVNASIQHDHLICLEDGKKYKSLRRHLREEHGLTFEGYRERWNLPENYPSVAAAHSAKRSELAKTSGLGKKRKTKQRG